MKKSKSKDAKDEARSVETTKPKREVVTLTKKVLRQWLLPQPSAGGDKEERGRVLIVGGAPEMPGAIVLSATAALRAGAGKLQIATVKSVRSFVAQDMPEAFVYALPETRRGGITTGRTGAAQILIEAANNVDAVLFGPGMTDEEGVTKLLLEVLPHIEKTCVVLDAAALACLSEHRDLLKHLNGRAIITPHAGEMASITGIDKEQIEADKQNIAAQWARELGAVVALKGRETFIAAPNINKIFRNRTGNVGLATSGSGDTLSGIVAGLAARGCAPVQAAAWSVYLHGRAGEHLSERHGRLGYLARELLAEIPVCMAEFDGKHKH